jgi:hypothetical protein
MANNLFITYDLIKTKDYPAVHEAIKALGSWASYGIELVCKFDFIR